MNWQLPALLTLLIAASPAHSDPARAVSVLPSEAQETTTGAAESFTGNVRVTARFQREDPARVGGGTVTFDAGARTAWHSHPLGQTLIVTDGEGWVQHWGGPAQALKTGDLVWIPPGVKHWHGAASHSGLRHIAISETLNGKSTDWMEHVTDEQYPAE